MSLHVYLPQDCLHALAATRTALPESEFQSAWDEGTKSSLEEAI